jgi:hypothetical protein
LGRLIRPVPGSIARRDSEAAVPLETSGMSCQPLPAG